jgi:hypothetical protein
MIQPCRSAQDELRNCFFSSEGLFRPRLPAWTSWPQQTLNMLFSGGLEDWGFEGWGLADWMLENCNVGLG